MAPTVLPSTQSNNRIGTPGSIAITVGIVLIICLGYLTHRFQPKAPINATEHQRLREAKLKKDTESRILHTIPVVSYNPNLRTSKAKPVTNFCNLVSITATTKIETKKIGSVCQESSQGRYLGEQIEQLKVPDPLVQSTNNRFLPERHATAKREPESCSICREAFQKGQKSSNVTLQPIYHRRCIDPWLLNFAGTCPLW